MNEYSQKPCKRCGMPSVGVFYDPDEKYPDIWAKSYYCNKHFFARKSVEDKEQDQREFEQWGDQQWYQELFPEKFGKMEDALERQYRQKKESLQLDLFGKQNH